MNTKEILNVLYQSRNRSVRFIANVIHCHHSKKAKKLRGLYNLAQEDRVGSGNDIDQVSIDGQIVDISELEKYA